jgi:LCP family protein required for cell wall assembly
MDVNNTANNIFNSINTENKRESQVVIEATQPISFVFLGVDNGAQGREEDVGRSDAILIGTVNPKTRTTTLVSIPRDTYALMDGYDTEYGELFYDKLTHAYAYGEAEMAINSIQELINVPIDYYVELNMQGLIDIVDALGGIEVKSPISFEERGYTFVAGKTYEMDGQQALVFARMRKFDLEGDYGRQKREKLVIKAMMDKILQFDTVLNYESLLKTLDKNVKTNLTLNDMTNLLATYGKSLENFKQDSLAGEELWLEDIYYFYIHPEERLGLSNKLREELELDPIEIEDLHLSDTDYYNLEYASYEDEYFEEEYVDDSY